MAELQAACRLQWEDAEPVQAAMRLQWEDAITVQSVGSLYVRPTPPPGGVPVIGGLAPRVNIPEQVSYEMTHSLAVYLTAAGIDLNYEETGNVLDALLTAGTTDTVAPAAVPTVQGAPTFSSAGMLSEYTTTANYLIYPFDISKISSSNYLISQEIVYSVYVKFDSLTNANEDTSRFFYIYAFGISQGFAIVSGGRLAAYLGSVYVDLGILPTTSALFELRYLANSGVLEYLVDGEVKASATSPGNRYGGGLVVGITAFCSRPKATFRHLRMRVGPKPPAPLLALPVRSVTMDLPDGSDLWTLRAEGDGSLYSTLTTGEQPPTVSVVLNGESWSFVIESIDAPQAFASSAVTFGGRSLAAVADAPYQAPQQWITDAPTTAAQLATIAQTFTGLEVRWLLPDWLIPAGAWSYSGSPLDVVREVAKAVGAVVEADRDGLGVTVQSRYPVLPNVWATTPPDWQIHWNAIERSTYTVADTPEYNAVYVAGQQQGGLLNARYAGTSGAIQAPMVTDPLLTDLPGLLERATAVLAGSGKQARVNRALQVGPQGVVPRGVLVRSVDPADTWTGMVRSVSVEAGFGKSRQTLGIERRTAFQAGLFVPP